jgi:hypothetical protein
MTKSKSLIHLQFTDDSTLGLRGHQSVRTTFKLSERSINALSILAGQMGIKQKSLFDHLVDDVQALKAIAEEFETFPGSEQRIAKTYVISRKTLESLERISSRYNTPRDALVEFSIERILPLIEMEKAKYSRRTKVARQLATLVEQSMKLLEEANHDLGADDPVVQEIYAIVRTADASYQRISAFLKKGRKIEDF